MSSSHVYPPGGGHRAWKERSAPLHSQCAVIGGTGWMRKRLGSRGLKRRGASEAPRAGHPGARHWSKRAAEVAPVPGTTGICANIRPLWPAAEATDNILPSRGKPWSCQMLGRRF